MGKKVKRVERFPLSVHKGSGQFVKKHNGKPYYFGIDRDAALIRYMAEWPRILQGLPRFDEKEDQAAAVKGLTIGELANQFLAFKRERVDSGELTRGMWGEYFAACEAVSEQFKPKTLASSLRPQDFGALRVSLSKRFGPVVLTKYITMVKSLFKYGFDAELINTPARYGKHFDKPSRATLRKHRASRPAKTLTAAECCKLIDGAGPVMKAIILLGLNCGFGSSDCSSLPWSAIDLEKGWVRFPRPKTGIERRCPLWPETVEALRQAEMVRPVPLDKADADQVFLSVKGLRLVRFVGAKDKKGKEKRGSSNDSVLAAFKELGKRLDVKLPSGPYILRHIHATIADEAKDRAAGDVIRGHADESMAGNYVERISDARLLDITNHVRNWLNAGRVAQPPAESGKEESPASEGPDVLAFKAVG